jgi:hypothetical protein
MHATKKILLSFGLFSLILFAPSLLGEVENEGKFKEQIIENNKTLFLNGVGLRVMTIFKVRVYLAALYLEKRMSDENEILKSDGLKEVELFFLRDVDTKAIVDSWTRGFRNNCKGNCETLRPQLEMLNAKMIDVSRGQRVGLLFGDQGLEVRTPGKEPVMFPGREFAHLMLSTFIGEVPPSPELKLGMLGKLQEQQRRAISSAQGPTPVRQ